MDYLFFLIFSGTLNNLVLKVKLTRRNHGVMANVPDDDIVVREFEPQ